MFNGLANFLGSVFKPVENGVNTIVHHPTQVPGNVLSNLANLIPHTNGPQGASPQQNDPLSSGRVFGNAVARNVAQQQGYTPSFAATVLNAHPYIGIGAGGLSNPSAGGDYNPATNQIELRSNQLDPYTVTHEGLHADWQHETPQQQQHFSQLVQQGLNPQAHQLINASLHTPLYAGASPAELTNEMHSYAPKYSSQLPNSAALQQYYRQYFANNNFNPAPKVNMPGRINNASGFDPEGIGYNIGPYKYRYTQ